MALTASQRHLGPFKRPWAQRSLMDLLASALEQVVARWSILLLSNNVYPGLPPCYVLRNWPVRTEVALVDPECCRLFPPELSLDPHHS